MLTDRHTCWEGLPSQDLFMRICAGVSFCTISVAFPVIAAQSWCFHSDTCSTVNVLPFMRWTWMVCWWLLMCDCEVQLSSWHSAGQSFEHAVRLCTIPLVLYNMLSAVKLRVWGVYIVRNTNKMHAFLNNLFHIIFDMFRPSNWSSSEVLYNHFIVFLRASLVESRHWHDYL